VCTLLLGFPWRRLEPWREKCGDRFPGMRPGGYLETFEGSWNSWNHGALRLPVRPVVEAQGKGGVAVDGLCDSEGVHSWGGTGMWGMRDRWLECC
jgi:hypothetical protein